MSFRDSFKWIAMLTSALCAGCGGGGSTESGFSLSVTVVEQGEAQVDWSPYPESNAYRVVRNGEPINSAVRDLSYKDRGLLAGARYCYVVRAQGSGGTFDASSNEVCVTMPGFRGGPKEAANAGTGSGISKELSRHHVSTN